MSVEDDIEMKDLLMQVLTDNGCLAKIRAQLRASVFLALEEDIKLNSKKPLLNENLKNCLDSRVGQLMFCIVKEFLEFFNLQSTLAVFNAESDLRVPCQYNDRKEVVVELGLNENESTPLLYQIINLFQYKTKVPEENVSMAEKSLEEIDILKCCSSLKTESNLNLEININHNSSSMVEESDLSHNDTSSDHINPTYTNEVGLNKTFTTEPTSTLKQPGVDTNFVEQLLNGKDKSSESSMCPMQSITSPMPISDKIDEVTPPILKDLKISFERVKSPSKTEKFKSKSNLNSADIPPLNMNKCKPGTILPSLYTKEFKEKPNS